MFACIGALGAQASLHAIWFVLAPVAAPTRIAIGLAGILVLFAAWAFGTALFLTSYSTWIDYWESVLMGLACLPLLALAVQTPLWMARVWDGWHIVHDDGTHLPPRTERLQIRHLFIATGAVAIALTAARLGTPDGSSSDTAFLNGLLIAGAVAAVTSLFTTLPLTVATLRARRVWLAFPATAVSAVVVAAGFIVFFNNLNQSAPPPEVYYVFCCVMASLYVATGGVLLVARTLGYRLLRGRDDRLTCTNRSSRA